MNAFDLAPAAVVRVAGWPMETLEQLAAPHLAEQATTIDPDDAAALAAYEEAYQHTLASQRQYLWRVTAGEVRFRCALALSSPSLVSRLGDGTPPAHRNKPTRHLEKSLYRYLARAVARIDPYGLWTGVTLAAFHTGETTQVAARAPRAHCAPELAPFRALLRALGQQEPYRTRGPYRLNPTLQMVDAQRWCYAHRKPDGTLCWRDLPAHRTWQVLYRRLAPLPAGSWLELRERLAEHAPHQVASAMLEVAYETGLLVGGLQFPTRFISPWDALAQAAAHLEAPERRAWSSACGSVKRTCAQLEQYIDALWSAANAPASEAGVAMAAEPVLQANTAVRDTISALAEALALPCPALPLSVLRCDLTAPWQMQLGQRDHQWLSALLKDWAHLESQCGAVKWHALRTQRMLHACGAERALMARPTPPGNNPTGARMEGPTRGMYSNAGTSPQALTPRCDAGVELGPPLGALVLRPARDGLTRSWVRGLSDVATATHARHAYHLAHLGDPLLPWFQATFQELERTCGVQIIDLLYDHPGSPNVLARPRYTERVMDPWGTTPGAIPDADARLVQGPHPASALLQVGSHQGAVHVFTAMAVPPTDVVIERLMATSFNWRTPLPSTAAATPELAALDAARHSRRPQLANGAISEPRCMRLQDQEVTALAGTRGAQRFRLWQQLARSYQWPALLRITCGSAPALLIPTDSPLALEVAFDGIRAAESRKQSATVRTHVLVEEVVEGPWLKGPHGHHLAELVLPVRRARHLWERPNRQR